MKNIILILGRPGSGKSEQLISYANQHKDETIFISLEREVAELYNERQLDTSIKVIESLENIYNVLNDSHKSICIDNLEVITDFKALENMLLFALKNNIRVHITSHLKKDFTYSPYAQKLANFLKGC